MSTEDVHQPAEPEAEQPDEGASSDGDGSWTDDPQTQDPHEDRSVEEVVRRTQGGAGGGG